MKIYEVWLNDHIEAEFKTKEEAQKFIKEEYQYLRYEFGKTYANDCINDYRIEEVEKEVIKIIKFN